MKIGIVGSRRSNSYFDNSVVMSIVKKAIDRYGSQNITVVSGGCPKGADFFAEKAADALGLQKLIFPVERKDFPDKYSFVREAFARNLKIAENSDIVFALVHSDRTGGTENTVSHCLNIVTPVILVDDDGRLYIPRGWCGDQISYEEAFEQADKGRAA